MLQVERLTADLVEEDITFSNVSFHINAGETYGILGDGNAGKTELIQLLSGLRTPEKGNVKIGDSVVHQNIRKAQQHLGVLSRTPALFSGMSVEHNLLFWGRLYDLSAHRLNAEMDRVLKQVGYAGERDVAASELSMLDQRRIHLAAALLHRPQVLLLDQPTEYMDSDEREAFIFVVQRLQQDGYTMLYTTDRVDEIQQIAHRVAILDEGLILAEGTFDELRSLLRGQSQVVIRCRPLRTLVSLIEEEALVHTVDERKNELRLWTMKPQDVLSRLFSERQQSGLVIESVQVVEPTLAGVYLHLTGKSLR